MALSIVLMALLLAAPFINVLACAAARAGSAATASSPAWVPRRRRSAVALTVALFNTIGAAADAVVAQIVAAVVGAAFVIGVQVGAILSFGTLSRFDVLQSQARARIAPDLGSLSGGRRAPCSATARRSLALSPSASSCLPAVIADLRRRASATTRLPRPACRRTVRRAASQRPLSADLAAQRAAAKGMDAAAARPVARCRRRLMQMLYLLPPASCCGAAFSSGGDASMLLGAGAGDGGGAVGRRPRLADDLGRGRARPRRHRADCRRARSCAPRSRRCSASSRWCSRRSSSSLAAGLAVARARCRARIVIAAASATAIQLWFRSQAKRSQFRRRQVSSRIATFAEAFSSIGWAGAAAVAAVSLPLAVIPALLALAVLAGARVSEPAPVVDAVALTVCAGFVALRRRRSEAKRLPRSL